MSFESFEASDLAIECMNGQYLCNRPIVVQYAFKKETQGERHGSQAERLLAASQPQRFKPHTIFSGGSGDSMINMSTTLSTIQATFQLQQQQAQLQTQMQMGAYGGLSFAQMPLQMSMPMGMMPAAPSTLPSFMQAPSHMMPPPPPPPPGMYGYGMDPSAAYAVGMPPPPPAMMGSYPPPPGMSMMGMIPPPPPPPM